MSSTSFGNIFYLIRQEGIFATGERAPDLRPFSREAREFTRRVREQGLATKYRIIRNQIFEILGVGSFAAIRELIVDEDRRRATAERAYLLIGTMFGITGTKREVIARVKSYSRTADAVIRYLQGKVLAKYASSIEMTNEIDMLTSPVDLLLIIFDNRYHRKARFEAKRKLILMSLAGSIDHRERETDIESKFADFLDFLNKHVWSERMKIGELEAVYLVSRHDPETFGCGEVKVARREDLAAIPPREGQKITLIKRRRFRVNGKEIPIYVTIRKKAPEAKVLKLIRKGEENPAIAVDDELGLMGVVESLPDVNAFQRHLTQAAIRAGSFMTLEDVSDTLSGAGARRGGGRGSDKSTAMFKFFARMGGMRVEFIVHTHESYLNYIYRKGVAHDEYEVRRIFDSGVAALLFPEEVYYLDMEAIRDPLIAWFRKQIEAV